MNAHSVPVKQISLNQVVQEYNAKLNGGDVTTDNGSGTTSVVATYQGIDAIIEDFKRAHTSVEMGSTVGGTYVSSITPTVTLSRISMERCLLESAWRHVYKGLNIDKIATAADRSRFDLELKTPPEFTIDNIRATFGKYLLNTRQHLLRGVAEVFADLDPAYKSHSKVKIGVEGLPKRIILTGFGEYSYGSYGRNKLLDILNALASLTDREHVHSGDVSNMITKSQRSEWWGGELKTFKNGNGHLSFNKDTLKIINMALAEFYGDTLPDTPDENVKKAKSTEVSKDLQYYPTPQAVIDRIFNHSVSIRGDGENVRFLEPDCGDGRIMVTAQKMFPKISTVGVEVHPGRVAAAQSNGLRVLAANFLQVKPNPVYDLIVMNPPFYGLHWKKHLLHACKFLRPAPKDRPFDGGQLICILPATAFYDGHLGEAGLVPIDAHEGDRRSRDNGWHDLPVASFADSGTNVPTGYFVTNGVTNALS